MEENQKAEDESREKLKEELRKKDQEFEILKNNLAKEQQDKDKKQKDIEVCLLFLNLKTLEYNILLLFFRP